MLYILLINLFSKEPGALYCIDVLIGSQAL